MKRIYDYLKKCGTYFLATDEDGQPRVRPFGTIEMFEGALYFQTGKSKDVSKQIHKNPKVELCAFDAEAGSWIRVEAIAEEDDRVEARKHMLDNYPTLRGMYDENDGNCEVFKLVSGKAVIASFTVAPEIIEIIPQAGTELSDDDLEGVSGGFKVNKVVRSYEK